MNRRDRKSAGCRGAAIRTPRTYRRVFGLESRRQVLIGRSDLGLRLAPRRPQIDRDERGVHYRSVPRLSASPAPAVRQCGRRSPTLALFTMTERIAAALQGRWATGTLPIDGHLMSESHENQGVTRAIRLNLHSTDLNLTRGRQRSGRIDATLPRCDYLSEPGGRSGETARTLRGARLGCSLPNRGHCTG